MRVESPIDPSRAMAALDSASDREQVIGLLLRAARSKTRFAALLTVHADFIRGRRAIADDGFDTSAIRDLQFERQSIPAFETVIDSGKPHAGPIATGEPFLDGLLELLGGRMPQAAIVLPLVIGDRTIALVVGHSGDTAIASDAGDGDIGDLQTLVDAMGPVLARLLASRAGAAEKRPGTRASTAPIAADPDDIVGQRRIAKWLREHAAWEELTDTIRGLIRIGMDTGEPDEDEQLELLYELGAVEAERLGRIDLAVEAWRGALMIDAGDRRVHDALHHLYRAHERWADYADLLETRAALTEPVRERIEILAELAELATDKLGDDDRAIAAYENIIRWEPTHDRAAKQLVQAYWAREMWTPLAALLLDRAGKHDDPDERVAALEVVAKVYEEGVADARAAFLVWIAVLRRSPDRVGLVDHLERLAPKTHAWDEIIAECESLARELSPEHPAMTRLWRLVGRWNRDVVGNLDQAAHALDQAARDDDVTALDELLDILRNDGPWVDLASTLERRAELEHDATARALLLAELGEVHDVRLGQIADAIGVLQQALASDPTCKPALGSLRRLYRHTAAWTELSAVLDGLVDGLGNTTPRAEAVELHVELGTLLADKLARPADAVRAFEAAIALDPHHEPAAVGLEHAHQALVPALLQTADWPALAAAHRAHLAIVDAGAERTVIQLALADVLANRLGDVDGAIAACDDILRRDPDHGGALDAIAELYDRAQRWNQAETILEKLLGSAIEARRRADLLTRLGHVQLGRGDRVKAEVSIAQALAVDPANPRAVEATARLHVDRGEVDDAGAQLRRAADLYDAPADAIRCLNDAAWLYRDRLADHDKAIECLRRVLVLSPDNHDAAQALSDVLERAGQWDALLPHLDRQLRRIADDPAATPHARHAVFVRAARCALELGDHATALDLYGRASEALPDHVATLIDRAEALSRASRWDAAVDAYNAVIARHGAVLDRGQSATIYRRLALVHDRLGHAAQALAMRQRALDVDPTNQDTLRDLVQRHLEQRRFDDAIAGLRTLADAVHAAADRAAIVEQIGDLYRVELANPARAASAYLQALELDAGNRRVLQKLLDLQTESGQWKAALDTIDRFLALESDPARRATYLLASAEIRRTELVDDDGALDCYDAAIDALLSGDRDDVRRDRAPATEPEPPDDGERRRHVSRALEAFGAVDGILAHRRDWKRLEQCYRKMIRRLPQTDPNLVGLWHDLGEIYRTRLVHHQTAIEAFEVAHSLDPEKSPERARILAELYRAIGAVQPEAAGDRAAKLVEVDPTNPDAYRALGRASLEAGHGDEAWCVARALVFLDRANADETALYHKYQTDETRKATGILDDDSWELVRHPDEDRVISAIFTVIRDAIAWTRAGPPRSFDLKPKERLEIEEDQRVMAKIFRHAARVLNAPLPEVYVQPRRSGRLMLANCIQKGRLVPTVIVGRDLMAGFRDTEIAAAVGGMLAQVRPPYFARLALTLDDLDAALTGVRMVAGVRARDVANAAEFAASIKKHVAPDAIPGLTNLITRLPERADVLRWRNAVDVASRRAGLLVAGELAAAARMASTEPAVPSGPRPSEKVQELVAYSVSPQYFAVRHHLGVTTG